MAGRRRRRRRIAPPFPLPLTLLRRSLPPFPPALAPIGKIRARRARHGTRGPRPGHDYGCVLEAKVKRQQPSGGARAGRACVLAAGGSKYGSTGVSPSALDAPAATPYQILRPEKGEKGESPLLGPGAPRSAEMARGRPLCSRDKSRAATRLTQKKGRAVAALAALAVWL